MCLLPRRTRPASSARALPIAFVVLGCLTACARASDPPAPRWRELAPGHEPGPLADLVAAWGAAGDPRAFRADGDAGVWVELPLDAAGWEPGGVPDVLDRPLPGASEASAPARLELRLDGARLSPQRRGAPPRVDVRDGRLVLALAPGSPAPETARLAAWFERGAGGRTAAQDGAQRELEAGLVVWPGERTELVLPVPAGSVLRFEPRVQALLAPARVTFRVWCDGTLVHERAARSGERGAPVAVPLPPAERALLVFEVTGDPAATAFARPVIGPAVIGEPGARPWADARPDVVLFVADTFRADLLTAYGGAPGLVPALDALAARSARFIDARSPATWTLPAHASLFAGTWPPQHDAEHRENALAPDIETLPEAFARAGYRTAAVTDGVFVSARHGFERGFETFAERRLWSLAATLAQAEALARADDGRPLFLFVHTYRTHTPYRVGPEEDGARYHELRREIFDAGRGPDGVPPAELAVASDEMRALYREGARALDAAFGPWLAALERQGLFRNGLLVFTSDHGEEFLEHGGVLHGGAPHDEIARVPLLIFGGGIEPRDVRLGASLVDVAPTLAARCGLAPAASWVGTDLLALRDERILFSCARDGERRLLGVTRGPQKLLAEGAPEVELPDDLTAAFDLTADPGEHTDVRASVAWPLELARSAAGAWEVAREPLARSEAVELDAAALEELRELGYGE